MLKARFAPYWNRWLARRLPTAPQVTLNQRRIFIVPTRVGAAFGVALVLMLLAAINYQSSLAYGLTFLLLAVFLVAILHTYRNLATLVLKAGGGNAVFVGEHARFQVRLESGGRAHQAIALGWPPEPLEICDVPADGAWECRLGQAAVRRGWLRPGRMRVETRFPLGILVAWSWVDLDLAALVYPRPLPGELPLVPAAGDEEEGNRAIGRGADDYQGLKPYQPGDSKRRLHWKAYSRGQGLLVKDFAALGGRELWLDYESLSGDMEMRVSLLCHWVLALSERSQAFGLTLPGVHLAPDEGEAHRDACLRALALFGVAR